jgi:hypothetical protein
MSDYSPDENEDGRGASGNGYEELHTALHIVHWFDLDKERPDNLP